jgi:hypothetical protein
LSVVRLVCRLMLFVCSYVLSIVSVENADFSCKKRYYNA